MSVSAIDLFCGVGGLSFGLKKAGISVVAGVDIDESCKYAYEKNVKAKFLSSSISSISGRSLRRTYWPDKKSIRILVGCAPCQPFSSHSNKNREKKNSEKWNLLGEFKRVISEANPQIVSMENVPNLSNQEIFDEFVGFLKSKKYNVSYSNVYCPDYGIPQKRRRLVLLASRLGEIKIIPKTHTPEMYVTLHDAIGFLPPVESGEAYKKGPLHKTTKLNPLNLARIKASKPKGTWQDWDRTLWLDCHKKESGQTYNAVYGRMAWDEPSSTITTQFYNFGTGCFGHPVQNRALTLREGALLQTFPHDYKFYKNESEIFFTKLGTHIGNAVPVDLGFVIGMSIKSHLREYHGKKRNIKSKRGKK